MISAAVSGLGSWGVAPLAVAAQPGTQNVAYVTSAAATLQHNSKPQCLLPNAHNLIMLFIFLVPYCVESGECSDVIIVTTQSAQRCKAASLGCLTLCTGSLRQWQRCTLGCFVQAAVLGVHERVRQPRGSLCYILYDPIICDNSQSTEHPSKAYPQLIDIKEWNIIHRWKFT